MCIQRLLKYATRGFAVAVPGLDPSRIYTMVQECFSFDVVANACLCCLCAVQGEAHTSLVHLPLIALRSGAQGRQVCSLFFCPSNFHRSAPLTRATILPWPSVPLHDVHWYGELWDYDFKPHRVSACFVFDLGLVFALCATFTLRCVHLPFAGFQQG